MYKTLRNVLDISCYAGAGAVAGTLWTVVYAITRKSKLRYITNPCTFMFAVGLCHKLAEVASDDVCEFTDMLHDAWVKSKEEPETEEN